MSLNKGKTLRTAEKYVLQGKIPAAIDEYRKVVDADPADMTTINTLGDLYVRAGRIPDAITNFSRIADSYRDSGFTLKAIAMLKKMSKLDPTNIDTSMKLANLYSQQGLFVEARQQYLQVADAYARAGQSRKALDAYQKIADLDPSNTSVRMKLGEIYSREGLIDQAHEAFIMAGAEFMRKGDTDQALAANLKALAIRPEGRQALTAIVSIYTQQGQADRAINILCDAFERNPGDVELLTILGRTYLAAGFMDDAERTFLSLVELDKNRYNYLLDVGRKFLQMGELDRAAEQIDGCLDVLISKREEDKGIDFLRRVLDRDPDHLGALRRLAQIFMRIREDHNLIATLNSLAEAAMRQNDNQAAIDVLQELVRLEPDEPRHRQRLYNLGIRDIAEPGAPDVVRATGPLDYQSAAFDDAFVIRQISEAEILAGHGQIDHAVSMLQEILNHAPENIQVHLKLKDIYLRAVMLDKAAGQCLELAELYETRGEPAKAAECMSEARQLNPALGPAMGDEDWNESAPAISDSFDIPMASGSLTGPDPFGIVQDHFDLNRYETGALPDAMGFVTAPPKQADKHASAPSIDHNQHHHGQPPTNGANADRKFSYSDTFIDGPAFGGDQADLQNPFFTSTGSLPSDTMPTLLRDELDGIDFYIAQGYIDIAHDTLNRLREEHGDHAEILARYQRLGIAAAPTREMETDALSRLGYSNPTVAQDQVQDIQEVYDQLLDQSQFQSNSQPQAQSFAQPQSPAHVEPPAEISFTEMDSGAGFGFEDPFAVPQAAQGHLDAPSIDAAEYHAAITGQLMAPESNGHSVAEIPEHEGMLLSIDQTQQQPEEELAMPFMVSKDSAPLSDDLVLRFNTSELPRDFADLGYTETVEDFMQGEVVRDDTAAHDFAPNQFGQPEIPAQDLSHSDTAYDDDLTYGEVVQPEATDFAQEDLAALPREDLTDFAAADEVSYQQVHASEQGFSHPDLVQEDFLDEGISAQPLMHEHVTGSPMYEDLAGNSLLGDSLTAEPFAAEAPGMDAAGVEVPAMHAVDLDSGGKLVDEPFAQESINPVDPLSDDLAHEFDPPAVSPAETPLAIPRPAHPAGTAELVASLLAGMDDSFNDLLGTPLSQPSAAEPVLETGPLAKPASSGDLHMELREMFEDLKGNTQELDPVTDYETYYSLGLAYKDMELWDDAVEQFQMAFKSASKLTYESESIQCCNMLGFCFKQKAMPKLAVMWFQRGIKVPNRTEDEYQALRFEVGLCYEEMGDISNAIDTFSEVYGIDVNYRHVSEKLRELQAAKRK